MNIKNVWHKFQIMLKSMANKEIIELRKFWGLGERGRT